MYRRFKPAPLAALAAALALCGCGDDGVGKTHPVAGKVLLGGTAIKVKSGYVMFKPDAQKGNPTKFEPTGQIDPDGSYVLYTKTRRGAPPGWYKVVVTAAGDPPAPAKGGKSRPLPGSLVPAKYGQEKTTPLSVEVVASPDAGAYDLNVDPKN